MSRLMDRIAVPMARASILWLIGEYADKVPNIAPDVLRKIAKTFASEVSHLNIRGRFPTLKNPFINQNV